jgi:hypothetical protein
LAGIRMNAYSLSGFSDYMASRWPELAPMKSTDIWHLLKRLEKVIAMPRTL